MNGEPPCAGKAIFRRVQRVAGALRSEIGNKQINISRTSGVGIQPQQEITVAENVEYVLRERIVDPGADW